MPVLTELRLYPVKSCAGIALREATITAAGLRTGQIHDREWMLVDANGDFLTQREYPRMALIKPHIRNEWLEINAPGMPMLEIPLEWPHRENAPTLQVRVWNDVVKAYDCDEATAAWFSAFLGVPCRLARFHPDARRVADEKWTGGVKAPALFADAFPMLVISEESLADLNGKLQAAGRDMLPMERFRPNLVVSGMGAFEEDYTSSFRIGEAVLKPVKPCARCSIPSVDQASGERGPDPLDLLRSYRVDPKVNGGITFGMNAILLEGEGAVLRVGQAMDAELAF